ncbi:MAG: outer membrane beta-barrel protein [Bryobacteraceae bacterium]
MKVRGSLVSLLALTFVLVMPALAQQSLDVYFGTVTNTVKARETPIDTFGTGSLFAPPKMTGAFPKFGANLKLNSWLGIGGEMSWRASKGGYAGLTYRPIFYDFYAMYTPPAKSKWFVPELQAGLGGANFRFYYDQRLCNAFTGCRTSSALVGTDNKFTTHFGGGVKMFVYRNWYVRPEFKLRWVNDLFQFGRNWVPEYGASVGYTFGGR